MMLSSGDARVHRIFAAELTVSHEPSVANMSLASDRAHCTSLLVHFDLSFASGIVHFIFFSEGNTPCLSFLLPDVRIVALGFSIALLFPVSTAYATPPAHLLTV